MDPRVKRTRENLNKALVELLDQKPLTKITVTELCQMAQINRSTYYLHYQDPYDQYAKLEQALYEEFADTMDQFIKTHHTWFTDLISTPRQAQIKLLEEIFSYIQKNARIYGSVLPLNQGNELLQKLYAVGRERFFSLKIKSAASEEVERFEYFFAFAANGCIGVMRQWVDRGMTESPRRMSELTVEMLHGSSPFIGD